MADCHDSAGTSARTDFQTATAENASDEPDTITAGNSAEVHARIMALSDEVMSLPLDVPWIARYAALAVAQMAEQAIGARDDLTATPLADSIRNLMAHEVWEKRQAWATAASAEAEA